jgi:hypothetical protein
MALLYFAAHLPYLAPSLEDIDSINFALGLRDFDIARHQPHPPGSPIYILLGRGMLAALSSVRSSLSQTAAEAFALGLWSAVGGGLALVAAAHLFAAAYANEPGESRRPRRAFTYWAVSLLAASPLFWLTGLRPMSDLPGLAAALIAQLFLLRGTASYRWLIAGAFLSGIAAGIRLQSIWLTLPLQVLATIAHRRLGARLLAPVGALAGGALVWTVPLVVDSGGLEGYMRALLSQAGEDFAWVEMLWLNPAPRRLAFVLYETFVLPWGSVPLAVAVAAASAVGTVFMLVRERRALGILLVAFGPYTIFHVLFQETLTVRYALPILPLVAWLAVRGVGAAGRLMPLFAAPLVVGALAIALPAAVAYGREPHPAFRAIADATRQAAAARPERVYTHHSLWRAVQAEPSGLPVVEPRRQYEWLGPVTYWKNGGAAPIWFFGDPRRTDLALIDPEALRDVARYRWAVADRVELSGTRPLGVDWYRLLQPGWFAGEGWSLTPEIGGLARATAAGPDHRPIAAWVRRRPEAVHLLVGGRHLGETGDPPAEFALALDGVTHDRWALTVEQRNFLRFVDIPAGIPAGSGNYAALTITSRAAAGDARRAAVGVRQFNLQSADRLLYGFGEGWHEEEYDPRTGQRWRWTSEKSVLRLKGAAGAIRIELRGESPLRYFADAPRVRVMAGGRTIGEFRPDADFEWTITIPAEDVARAAGAIAIETDRVYLPGPAEGTTDQRHLGLRLYECDVSAVTIH